MASRPKLRDGARLTFRTLGLVWRGSPLHTTLLGILTLASAVLPLAIAFAGKGIIDAVVARSTALALRWVLIELGVVAAQAVVQRGLGLTRQLLGARLSLDINFLILQKAT